VDQLMRMCWKYLVPLTFFNLLGVSLWLLAFDGKGIPAMIASLFG
jgi:NADH-quinone oxidoreductase subunit H